MKFDLGGNHDVTLQQVDTYYRLPDGRLKRRESPGLATQYIHYYRDDDFRPRVSDYTIYTEDQARTRWGMVSLREWLIVVKTREVYLIDNVRIHLDRVRDLGDFIEFALKFIHKFKTIF